MGENRVLRVAVVLGDSVVDERLFRSRQTVTLGQSARCVLSVPARELPRSFPLFTVQGEGYALSLPAGADLRLADGDGGVLTLAQLVDLGRAQKLADRTVVRVPPQARGKIIFSGDVKVLFQMVVAPPLQPRAQLPRSVRGRLSDRIDPYLAAVLALSVVVHGVAVGWFASRDPELPPEASETPARYQRTAHMQPLYEVRGKLPGAASSSTPASAPAPSEPTSEPAPTPGKPAAHASNPGPQKSPEEIAAEQRASVQATLVLLGKKPGEAPGRFEDVTGGKLPGGDMTIAVEKAAKHGGLSVSIGPTGGIRDQGPVGPIGVPHGPVVDGPREQPGGNTPHVTEDTPALPPVIGKPTTSDPGGLDAGAIYDKIRSAYAGRVQKCYTDALNLDGALEGRVDVTITIGVGGNVTQAEVDGFNGKMSACIEALARGWHFAKPASPATFEFPLSFKHR